MREICNVIERIAPCDAPVLLTGETGVGKEVIAEMIHEMSPRRNHRMICINTAALPRELIEAELFGSIKGAYTGAMFPRKGLFAAADKSTLFLDELSEMDIDMQTKLLRVLQDGFVRPVGGVESTPVNIRVIAACNQNAEDLIRDGRLREDLYYRISTIRFDIPPLRERFADILPMTEAFLAYYAAETKTACKTLSNEAKNAIQDYAWPGNIRQLRNEMQRLTIMAHEPVIQPSHLRIVVSKKSVNVTGLAAVERSAIVRALRHAGGNKLEATRLLGIGRQTLYNKISVYEIETNVYHLNGHIKRRKKKTPIDFEEEYEEQT